MPGKITLMAWANTLFSALNSFNLGVRSSLYFAHHINHHRYNNGLEDRSSLWLHGQNGRMESFWKYAFLSPLRTDFAFLLRRQLWYESLFFAATFITVAFWSPYFVLIFVLPSIYLGQVLAAGENYLEHADTDPNDRLRNSVSAYGRWYNLIWLNNGYHQEHHVLPSLHWTRLPEVQGKLPPDRRIVDGSHWFSLWGRRRQNIVLNFLENQNDTFRA